MNSNTIRRTFGLLICFLVSAAIVCTAAAKAESEKVVVALANEKPIYKSELDMVIEEYKRKTDKTEVTDEEVNQLLKSLIRRKLILGLDSVEELRKNDEVVKRVKAFEDQVVVQIFLQQNIGRHLSVTEEEISTFYRENMYLFSSPPKVKASHILLKSRQEAEMVQEELRNGVDFPKLAAEYSIDLPMALEGGSMGIIEKGKTLPQLEEALFTLDVGEYSDIVKTQYGYHILTVDEIITDPFKPLKEVQQEIRKRLIRQKEAEAFNAMAEKLEDNASIKIYSDRL